MKFYDGLNEDDDNSESEDTETESSDGESKDQSSDSPKYPTVVMHCGAQNGFGGNTEDYAFCVYSEDDGEYIYSKEELVAEIGSASILNYLGIETKGTFQNSASYIESCFVSISGYSSYSYITACPFNFLFSTCNF